MIPAALSIENSLFSHNDAQYIQILPQLTCNVHLQTITFWYPCARHSSFVSVNGSLTVPFEGCNSLLAAKRKYIMFYNSIKKSILLCPTLKHCSIIL